MGVRRLGQVAVFTIIPVEEGLVFMAQDYLNSSAADDAREKGILENVIVVK